MMQNCDVCHRELILHDEYTPVRSRCYSCETSEKHWRAEIAREITEAFNLDDPDTDLRVVAIIESVIELVGTPLPPPVPYVIPVIPVATSTELVVRSTYVQLTLEGPESDIVDAEIVSETPAPRKRGKRK